MKLMPPRLTLGNLFSSTISHMLHIDDHIGNLFSFKLSKWQRSLTWTTQQEIAFMESVWTGIPIGNYSYNVTERDFSLDLLLIDGQQRINTIYRYINDKFRVFDYYYSELNEIEQREFRRIRFDHFETRSEDEQFLKDYYNRLNFSGTRHTEDQRA